MGSLQTKSLSSVIDSLRRTHEIDNFVETGTYLGATTRWASERFRTVHTIDINSDFLTAAKVTLADCQNIYFHIGDSRGALPEIVGALEGATVFWLDAHKGGGFFGEGDDCPILEEIEAINRGGGDGVILIDDARGFLSPPPPPFDWSSWPDLKTVLDAACTKPERTAVVFDDVIVCVPLAMRDCLRAELHRVKPKL